ncbi:MAG: DUF4339 domain-containing protein, partial [Lentisphaerae bacterium]|nr:DUF4339 domain-containing protein [Lentisphaerota bacterium]
MRWYYADKGETRGPVTREDLRRLVREGRVKPNDYVWHPSMGENWTEARNVSGLLETAAPAWAPPGPEPAAGRGVSCVAAVGPAWQGMKSILFRPFEIGKWFALGFAAWLASLGQGGGSGGGNLNPARPGEQKPKLDDAVA